MDKDYKLKKTIRIMEKKKHVFWESLLIIASVLVFRSLWLLMDEVELFWNPIVLVIFFIIGMILMGWAVYKITHSH